MRPALLEPESEAWNIVLTNSEYGMTSSVGTGGEPDSGAGSGVPG